MNGGKQPIVDGDLLLLKLIHSDSAGSIRNQTLVIEQQDASGDDQYLLRTVKKIANGCCQLHASNPEYPDITASDQMKPLARLKSVVMNSE